MACIYSCDWCSGVDEGYEVTSNFHSVFALVLPVQGSRLLSPLGPISPTLADIPADEGLWKHPCRRLCIFLQYKSEHIQHIRENPRSQNGSCV